MSQSCPLITFALFAFNQESCIEKAVSAAFAQVYPNLEIILSDDCSSDQTFQIMENMARCYTGPHKIVLNRNGRNLGIGGHVSHIGKIASGDWVVMAAGDDLSHPNRVQRLWDVAEKHPRAFAISSNSGIFGKSLPKGVGILSVDIVEFVRCGFFVASGAYFMYRRECFSSPIEYPAVCWNEDAVLPLHAMLLGEFYIIPDNLVKRKPGGSWKETEAVRAKNEIIENHALLAINIAEKTLSIPIKTTTKIISLIEARKKLRLALQDYTKSRKLIPKIFLWLRIQFLQLSVYGLFHYIRSKFARLKLI